METFRAFTWEHVAALVSIAVACWMVVAWGRRLSRRGRAWLGRGLGLTLAGFIAHHYWALWQRGGLAWSEILPLYLCNIVLILVAVCAFRPRPALAELVYFGALGGGLQALLQPDIGKGFPSLEYVEFFVSHGLLMVAVAWLVGCMDMTPRAGAVWRAMLWTNVYVVAVGALDAVTGWNYGYLCRPPARPSLLDHMGPWPWYIVSAEFVALGIFIILDIPWWKYRARHNGDPDETRGAPNQGARSDENEGPRDVDKPARGIVT